jgi:CheY-like chemotaxis protein
MKSNAIKPDSEAAKSPQGTETILLVEDEPMVREMTVRVLRQQGYIVLQATNGEAALQLAQAENQLHLLITDVMMPQMGGDLLAKQLISLNPSLKVLFITGYTDSAIARRGVLASGFAVLSKPFTPANLIRKVRSVLDGEAPI